MDLVTCIGKTKTGRTEFFFMGGGCEKKRQLGVTERHWEDHNGGKEQGVTICIWCVWTLDEWVLESTPVKFVPINVRNFVGG